MKINKKNILKSLVSALMISIFPLIITKNLVFFIYNFTTIFLNVFIACCIVDLFFKIKKEKETWKNLKKKTKN